MFAILAYLKTRALGVIFLEPYRSKGGPSFNSNPKHPSHPSQGLKQKEKTEVKARPGPSERVAKLSESQIASLGLGFSLGFRV